MSKKYFYEYDIYLRKTLSSSFLSRVGTRFILGGGGNGYHKKKWTVVKLNILNSKHILFQFNIDLKNICI